MAELRALTLHPEWAWAICYLGKRIENRSWRRESLRGKTLAIHGGRLIGGDSDQTLWRCDVQLMLQHARTRCGCQADLGVGPISVKRILDEGRGIVALARVADFVTASQSGWFVGPIGWVLEDVRVLCEPVPCAGAQGVWTVPCDVAARAQAAVVRG